MIVAAAHDLRREASVRNLDTDQIALRGRHDGPHELALAVRHDRISARKRCLWSCGTKALLEMKRRAARIAEAPREGAAKTLARLRQRQPRQTDAEFRRLTREALGEARNPRPFRSDLRAKPLGEGLRQKRRPRAGAGDLQRRCCAQRRALELGDTLTPRAQRPSHRLPKVAGEPVAPLKERRAVG